MLFPVSDLSKKYFVSSMASLVVFVAEVNKVWWCSLTMWITNSVFYAGDSASMWFSSLLPYALISGSSVSFSSSMVPTSSAASLIL